MTTTDLSALLAAVIADPEEDTVRLAFADAIEEAGQAERAEFIRNDVKGFTPEHPEYVEGRGWKMTWPQKLHAFAFPGFRAIGWDKDYVCYTHNDGTKSVKRVDVKFDRGFVCEVRCTAEDWLRHADAIFWHPSQTVACGVCQGHGIVYWPAPEGVAIQVECARCDGTGRIPRPCPPTAHPIREVTLTTMPQLEVDHVDGRFRNRIVGRKWHPTATTQDIMSREFPGVTFRLPG